MKNNITKMIMILSFILVLPSCYNLNGAGAKLEYAQLIHSQPIFNDGYSELKILTQLYEKPLYEEQLYEKYIAIDEPNLTYHDKVAIEFLSQFLSIFSLGLAFDPNIWTFNGNPDIPHLVTLHNRDDFVTFYHDVNGEIIDEAPFLIQVNELSTLVAVNFILFDLNGNGIPEIMITYAMPETCWNFNIIYQYIEGSYRRVRLDEELSNSIYAEGLNYVSLPFVRFFVDEQGRDIMYIDDIVMGSSHGYWHIDLDEGYLRMVESLVAIYGHHEATKNISVYEWLIDFPYHGISIPGYPNSSLYSRRMEELEKKFVTEINRILGIF